VFESRDKGLCGARELLFYH